MFIYAINWRYLWYVSLLTGGIEIGVDSWGIGSRTKQASKQAKRHSARLFHFIRSQKKQIKRIKEGRGDVIQFV